VSVDSRCFSIIRSIAHVFFINSSINSILHILFVRLRGWFLFILPFINREAGMGASKKNQISEAWAKKQVQSNHNAGSHILAGHSLDGSRLASAQKPLERVQRLPGYGIIKSNQYHQFYHVLPLFLPSLSITHHPSPILPITLPFPTTYYHLPYILPSISPFPSSTYHPPPSHHHCIRILPSTINN
jgi:hypothetical protein